MGGEPSLRPPAARRSGAAGDGPAKGRVGSGRTVRRLDTGEVWPTITQAARDCGLRTPAPICAAIRSGGRAAGARWEYASASKGRPVRCVETGEEFGSAADAGRAMGSLSSSPGSNIRAQLAGRVGTAFGHHWEYADEAGGW